MNDTVAASLIVSYNDFSGGVFLLSCHAGSVSLKTESTVAFLRLVIIYIYIYVLKFVTFVVF